MPRTAKPSGRPSISAPSPARPSTIPAIRSDSLARSSAAPLTTVSPSAKQPSRATSGSSSMAEGTSSAVIAAPLRGADRTLRRAIGSGPGSRISSMVIAGGSRVVPSARPCIRWAPPISTPMRERMESRPIRARLMPTSRSPSSLPGTIRAATRKKAAEEKSPGTGTSPASSRSVGETVMLPPSRRISAPADARRRSVWSRVQCGSWTVVVPSASRPASSTHDLTCALATGSS